MAWNIQPSREEIAFLMEAGVIYRDAKRFPEAEEVFRGVRALSPRSDVPEVALGTVQFAQVLGSDTLVLDVEAAARRGIHDLV